jgi:hypothetical protein
MRAPREHTVQETTRTSRFGFVVTMGRPPLLSQAQAAPGLCRALPRFLLPSDAGIDSGSTHAISEQERTKHTTAQYSSARPRVRIRGRSILRVQGNHGQTRIEDEVKWDELQDTLARCQT